MCQELKETLPHESFDGLCNELHTFASGCGKIKSNKVKTCRAKKTKKRQTILHNRTHKYKMTGGFLWFIAAASRAGWCVIRFITSTMCPAKQLSGYHGATHVDFFPANFFTGSRNMLTTIIKRSLSPSNFVGTPGSRCVVKERSIELIVSTHISHSDGWYEYSQI